MSFLSELLSIPFIHTERGENLGGHSSHLMGAGPVTPTWRVVLHAQCYGHRDAQRDAHRYTGCYTHCYTTATNAITSTVTPTPLRPLLHPPLHLPAESQPWHCAHRHTDTRSTATGDRRPAGLLHDILRLASGD